LLLEASKIKGNVWITDDTLMTFQIDSIRSASRINVDEDYVEDFRKDLNISADDHTLLIWGIKETTLSNGTNVRVQSKGIHVKKGAYHLVITFFPTIQNCTKNTSKCDFYFEKPWEFHMIFNEKSQCNSVDWTPHCFEDVYSGGYWLKAYLRTAPAKTIPSKDLVFISSYVEGYDVFRPPMCSYSVHYEPREVARSMHAEFPFLYGHNLVGVTFFGLRMIAFAKLEQPEFPEGKSFNPCNVKRENIFKQVLSRLKEWYVNSAPMICLIVISTVLGIALSKKLINDQKRIRFLECAYTAQGQNDKEEKETAPTTDNGDQFENKAYSPA